MRKALILLALLVFWGCSQTARPQYYWARIDGGVRTSAAQEQQDALRAKSICDGRIAQLDAMAPRQRTTSSVSPFEYPNPLAQSMTDFGNATSDLGSAIRRSQDLNRAYSGCMAELGYRAVRI